MKRYLLPGVLLCLIGSNAARAESLSSPEIESVGILNRDIAIAKDLSQAEDVRLQNFPFLRSIENTEFTLAEIKIAANYLLALRQPANKKVEVGNHERLASSLTGTSAIDTSSDSLNQVTNVNQLRDVAPDDWAYEALRSLVDRYFDAHSLTPEGDAGSHRCIAGFPDRTFRGDRPLSRYEFAAGLNSCLQQIERLIAASEAVAQEDLETARRLSEEFEAELATIAGRVDSLEDRVSFLEDNQFSTTTILNGEVIFALADAFGGDPLGGCSIVPDGGDANDDSDVECFGSNTGKPETETILTYLVRLGLQSSFTGKDRLRMFLTSGNFDDGGFTNPESLNTYMARFGYQADYNSEVFLDLLEYRFPAFDDKVVFYGSAFGFSLSNVLTANAPFFDIGRGAVSRFGQLNPILRIGGAMNAGVGFDWEIIDAVRLQAAYGTRDSGNDGFFGADHSALGAQILVQPTDTIVAGINYVNAYSGDATIGTYTGSVNAETLGLWSQAGIADTELGSPTNKRSDAPSGFGCCGRAAGDLGAQINAVGGSLQWRAFDKVTFAAWGGYIFADFVDSLPDTVDGTGGETPSAEVATFTLSLGYSDPFGREGDLFGFIFGMPPKLVKADPETVGVPVPFFENVIQNEDPTPVTDNNPNINNVERQQVVGQEDEATSLHFEFFYRFKVNDNIFITPGFFFVTNPGHIEDNETIYVGTIRTTYRF